MQKDTLLVGVFVSVMGLFVLFSALNVIPSDDASYNAPRWVAAVAGIVFVVAGVILLLMEISVKLGDYRIGGIAPVDVFQSFFGMVIFVGLALIANWVAFGPGEREFSGSLSIGVGSIGGLTSEWVGRACFGGGAILLDLFLLAVLMRAIRQVLQRVGFLE